MGVESHLGQDECATCPEMETPDLLGKSPACRLRRTSKISDDLGAAVERTVRSRFPATLEGKAERSFAAVPCSRVGSCTASGEALDDYTHEKPRCKPNQHHYPPKEQCANMAGTL